MKNGNSSFESFIVTLFAKKTFNFSPTVYIFPSCLLSECSVSQNKRIFETPSGVTIKLADVESLKGFDVGIHVNNTLATLTNSHELADRGRCVDADSWQSVVMFDRVWRRLVHDSYYQR